MKKHFNYNFKVIYPKCVYFFNNMWCHNCAVSKSSYNVRYPEGGTLQIGASNLFNLSVTRLLRFYCKKMKIYEYNYASHLNKGIWQIFSFRFSVHPVIYNTTIKKVLFMLQNEAYLSYDPSTLFLSERRISHRYRYYT